MRKLRQKVGWLKGIGRRNTSYLNEYRLNGNTYDK